MKTQTIAALIALSFLPSLAFSETVTVDTFCRAETDMTLSRYAKQGAFGHFLHIRQPTPIDRQDVVRMNRDTLYSAGIFDLTEPLTVVKPESGGRFQSMLVINQDHSMLPVEHGPGTFTFTQETVGTRFVAIAFRTFMDPSDPKDLEAAHALQDKIEVRQASPGTFEVPAWDEASLHTVRNAIKVLANTLPNFNGCFGDKAKLDPIRHLLGTAAGWGGNPDEAARYINVFPAQNDGTTPHAVTVRDVPVDGFWSITVYDKDGYMAKNDLGINSYNNVTAKKNADGGITIHFGGEPSAVNYIPITPGWNYTVRLYQPGKAILDGSYAFPEPIPVKP